MPIQFGNFRLDDLRRQLLDAAFAVCLSVALLPI